MRYKFVFFLSSCAALDATKWPTVREAFYTVFWSRFAVCTEFDVWYIQLDLFDGCLRCESRVLSIRSDLNRAAKHKRSHVTAEAPTFCWFCPAVAANGSQRAVRGNLEIFERNSLPKKVNSVIYSPSLCSSPIWLIFFLVAIHFHAVFIQQKWMVTELSCPALFSRKWIIQGLNNLKVDNDRISYVEWIIPLIFASFSPHL